MKSMKLTSLLSLILCIESVSSLEERVIVSQASRNSATLKLNLGAFELHNGEVKVVHSPPWDTILLFDMHWDTISVLMLCSIFNFTAHLQRTKHVCRRIRERRCRLHVLCSSSTLRCWYYSDERAASQHKVLLCSLTR